MDLQGNIDERQSSLEALLARLLLAFYTIELILNRILIRILIFIPHSRILDILAVATTYGGRFALNITSILGASIITFSAIKRRGYSLALAVLFVVLVLTDYLELIRLYWLLPIIAILVALKDRRRVVESLALASLAATSMSASPIIHYASQILWIAAPLPAVSRRRLHALKWSVPLAILVLIPTLANPYIMSQILIFGMGLVSPWLLPVGIIVYSLAEPSWGRYGLLITGPRLQLSNQIISLTGLYLAEINSIGGGRGRKA
jgi:uncharacterized membrane protein YhaH (DUF805 family)